MRQKPQSQTNCLKQSFFVYLKEWIAIWRRELDTQLPELQSWKKPLKIWLNARWARILSQQIASFEIFASPLPETQIR